MREEEEEEEEEEQVGGGGFDCWLALIINDADQLN